MGTSQRNNYILQDKINDDILKQYNEKCATLAWEVLKSADWLKYRAEKQQ